MSPRNTAAATIKLLKEATCHTLITTKETLETLIHEIKDQLALTDPNFVVSVEEVPPLVEIYPRLGHETLDDPFEPYPTASRLSMDDILIYLHSSGSTGLPKSIPHTVLSIINWASFRQFFLKYLTIVCDQPQFYSTDYRNSRPPCTSEDGRDGLAAFPHSWVDSPASRPVI